MSEYLYFFNYSHLEQELFVGEVAALFGQEVDENYLISNIQVPVDNSVYIKDVIKIMIRDCQLENVLAYLKTNQMEYEEFKVVYLKNKKEPLAYQERLSLVRQVGTAIAGQVAINNPKATIAITRIGGEYVVGELSHGQESWRKFIDKPHTFCNGLDLRMCKSLINLATGNKAGVRVVDPCCGMGSVVLEGLNQGVDILGFDISRTNSYKARLNLEHFGYDGQLIARCSIADLKIKRDVAIIDLPYNLYTPITRIEQEEIIKAGLTIAPKLILVAHDDYDGWFAQQGIEISGKMTVKKFANGNFARIIYILSR